MWAFLLTAAKWAFAERAMLAPIIARWRGLASSGGAASFDGPAVLAAIDKWEPLAFEVAKHVLKGGLSIRAAIVKVAVEKLGLHPMTFEEEQAWMNRHGANTG